MDKGFEMIRVTPGIASRYYGRSVRTLARWFDRKSGRLEGSDTLDRPYRSHRRYWVPRWFVDEVSPRTRRRFQEPCGESTMSVSPETTKQQGIELKREKDLMTMQEIHSLRMVWDGPERGGLSGQSLEIAMERETMRLWSLLFLRSATVAVKTDRSLVSSIKESRDVSKGAFLLERAALSKFQMCQDWDDLDYDDREIVDYDILDGSGLDYRHLSRLSEDQPKDFPRFVSEWCKRTALSLILEGQDSIDLRPILDVVKNFLTVASSSVLEWKFTN